MPNIVNVEVSQQVASTPNQLQRTGAFISQGGTTTAAGTPTLITSMQELMGILTPSISIVSAVWSAGLVTVTTSAPHGIPTGKTVQGVISDCAPAAYNGTFACTETGATTFTYPLASDPGAITTIGNFQLYAATQLEAMGTTFFAQGATLAVYVLELGVGEPADGVTALQAYIIDPLIQFYSYLLPTEWDTEPTAPAFVQAYDGLTAQQYFYVTTTLATYSNWLTYKSVFATLQSPSAPSGEFSAAAIFHNTLSYNPSSVNLAAPLSFQYVYAVTPYTALTGAQQTTLKAAGVNWIGTGAEGGISNTLILWGSFMDLNPFNYWYSIDWLSINVAQALAAAIINGSNLPTNPLYFNQAGINTLQKVAQATVNNGIAFGLILNPATVTATPFATYVQQHPGDYSTGTYNGLAVTFVPLRGFESITIYLTASNIPV